MEKLIKMKQIKNSMRKNIVITFLTLIGLSLLLFSGCSTSNTSNIPINVQTINSSPQNSSNSNPGNFTTQIGSTLSNQTIQGNSTVSIGGMI